MRIFRPLVFLLISALLSRGFGFSPQAADTVATQPIFGFRDSSKQAQIDKKFLAVPDAKLAEQHLQTLTAEPHIAGSPEDKKTADYVARKFRAAGLDTQTVEYKIWMNYPKEISVTLTAPAGVRMNGPHEEHVNGDDPFQNDKRVVMPFNAYSPSGDVEADVVYANYGRPEDFDKLREMNVDVRGKVVIVRYGANFRGVKSFVAQERGAGGVLIYSDPMDDGYFKGDVYPQGPFRPELGVQRGSIAYMFKYPGDPTSPGISSTLDLPESARISPEQAASLPKIPTTPLSYGDTRPILENVGGPESPREWQGALPFTYHVGPGPAKVKMHLLQDYRFRSIWNVIGKIPGSEFPDEWVVAGNHRDAWVYGAVDPNSGTAAMLEAVHGLGELLKTGWQPKRTIVIGSWDAEEQGLIGSTEWGEQHEHELEKAAAYFNMDVGVSGSDFGASAVPALKQFVREVTKAVPSPEGGTLYEVWKRTKEKQASEPRVSPDLGGSYRPPNARVDNDVPVGDLGSGSDYTVFLEHLGIPATDITCGGNYGVYHSVFDNFAYYKRFSDPDFKYSQQMARVFGIELLHMADADVLPYDYALYGKEIAAYLDKAKKKSDAKLGPNVADFTLAIRAAQALLSAGQQIAQIQRSPSVVNIAGLNAALRNAERALLLTPGLPHRPWFRHAIYAPGQYTGYAAVVIPGVNEAIDDQDAARARQQLQALSEALNKAASVLESYRQNSM